MLKIKCSLQGEKINGYDIPETTLFYGNVGYMGKRGPSLYLRIYGGIVDLRNSGIVWSNRSEFNFPEVLNYRPVDGTLTVEE